LIRTINTDCQPKAILDKLVLENIQIPTSHLMDIQIVQVQRIITWNFQEIEQQLYSSYLNSKGSFQFSSYWFRNCWSHCSNETVEGRSQSCGVCILRQTKNDKDAEAEVKNV
jgi:hypothetical protein